MRNSIARLSLLIGFIVIGIMLVGCNSDNSKTNDQDSQSDNQEVSIAIEAEPVGLSPTGISDINSYQSTNHIYENLFERDAETGEVVPHLATSYENPDDT